MKKLIVLFVIAVSALMTHAQNPKIEGNWLIEKIEQNGEIQETLMIFEFKSNGKMETMNMEVGTWRYNKKENSIDMSSEFDKDFDGRAKVLALDNKEMTLKKDGIKIFYTRITPEEIAMLNEFSDLAGTWQIQISENVLGTLKLELPDSFVFVESQEGMTTTNSGTWIYKPEDESLLIIGMQSIITGKSIIVAQSEDELILEKNGTTIIAQKVNTETGNTGRLDFTEDDFFDDNGEYKYYTDEGNLPWLNSYEMLMSLLDVQHLVYSYSTQIQETEAFDTKTLTADVVANEDEQTLSIDYIFYGYDRYNLPYDTDLPPNDEYSEPLYPIQADLFRISGEEEITCPAGTFECTVVEAMGENENRLKIWMINNMPGVYAKIIDDKPGEWGYFAIFELVEIR